MGIWGSGMVVGGGEGRCKIWMIQHSLKESSSQFSQFESRSSNSTFPIFYVSLSLSMVEILISRLNFLSIEVCIPPEEEALASKACGINICLDLLFVC